MRLIMPSYCADDKSQVQALERTQQVLSTGLGYLEGVTHDYYRHGRATLFAVLDVGNRQVLAHASRIVDNYSRLARHRRFHMHYTPTYSF
jgi:putative transposase